MEEKEIIPNLSESYDIEQFDTSSYMENSVGVRATNGNVQNLFVNIGDEILANSKVSSFVSEFNRAQSSFEFGNIKFNTFTISELTDKSITLEWIYNYFRSIISFDKESGDMYGLVLSNTIDRIYRSEFKPLTEGHYYEASIEIIQFVLQNI